MSGASGKQPKRKGPVVTANTRSRGLIMLAPKQPSNPNPGWENPTAVGMAINLADSPPAGADVGWVWSELQPLREWLARQSVALDTSIDADRVIRRVVEVVETQRPALGTVPPQDYLRTLAEKIVLQAV